MSDAILAMDIQFEFTKITRPSNVDRLVHRFSFRFRGMLAQCFPARFICSQTPDHHTLHMATNVCSSARNTTILLSRMDGDARQRSEKLNADGTARVLAWGRSKRLVVPIIATGCPLRSPPTSTDYSEIHTDYSRLLRNVAEEKQTRNTRSASCELPFLRMALSSLGS